MRVSDFALRPTDSREYYADQQLSRPTVSFKGLRLPQNVLDAIEQADADARKGSAVRGEPPSLLHGPEQTDTRIRLRTRAIRALTIVNALKGMQEAGRVYWQCSVLDLEAPHAERYALLVLKRMPETLAALERWNATTSSLLCKVEARQLEVHQRYSEQNPDSPPLPWEPSQEQLRQSQKLADGFEGGGSLDPAGYAYMQALIASALNPAMDEAAIAESAADDYMGDIEKARESSALVLTRALSVQTWGESLLELASVWSSATDVAVVVSFLDRLRERVERSAERKRASSIAINCWVRERATIGQITASARQRGFSASKRRSSCSVIGAHVPFSTADPQPLPTNVPSAASLRPLAVQSAASLPPPTESISPRFTVDQPSAAPQLAATPSIARLCAGPQSPALPAPSTLSPAKPSPSTISPAKQSPATRSPAKPYPAKPSAGTSSELRDACAEDEMQMAIGVPDVGMLSAPPLRSSVSDSATDAVVRRLHTGERHARSSDFKEVDFYGRPLLGEELLGPNCAYMRKKTETLSRHGLFGQLLPQRTGELSPRWANAPLAVQMGDALLCPPSHECSPQRTGMLTFAPNRKDADASEARSSQPRSASKAAKPLLAKASHDPLVKPSQSSVADGAAHFDRARAVVRSHAMRTSQSADVLQKRQFVSISSKEQQRYAATVGKLHRDCITAGSIYSPFRQHEERSKQNVPKLSSRSSSEALTMLMRHGGSCAPPMIHAPSELQKESSRMLSSKDCVMMPRRLSISSAPPVPEGNADVDSCHDNQFFN
ncbi:hypothetical protein AB1Y20_012712 [Prymnesium parvum]|uniref:Rapamycin-insensitive companion of mTOR domain-containing protein n=1 Tax=Prymnesium parvum TaxID=97485 RepID=A0AB34IJF5_PRYPA